MLKLGLRNANANVIKRSQHIVQGVRLPVKHIGFGEKLGTRILLLKQNNYEVYGN